MMNSKVVIVHSIKDNRTPSELYPDVKHLYSQYSKIEDVYKIAGNKLLEIAKKKFGTEQNYIETRLIEKESPEDYICRIAKEENFDLIVLGSRGQHSKIKKALLGTVSSKVAKDSPCDVLLVK